MHYGMMHFWCAAHPEASRPPGPAVADFGSPVRFTPQKTRAVARAKRLAAAGALVAAGGAALLVRSLLR